MTLNLLKSTACVMRQQVLHSRTLHSATPRVCVCVCVLYLSQNKQRILPHINSLVFIIQMKSVYSAVRTGSLNKADCASSLSGESHVLYLSENKQRLVPLTA